MLGAIAGDMIGSAFKGEPIKTTEFPLFSADSRFTDDTVLTVATAFAILSDGDYAAAYKIFGRLYPMAGYGMHFTAWLAKDDSAPYDSWGNGSAMRVGPVGFAFGTETKVVDEAKRSAECSHNHAHGIKGAQATALAVYLARQGASKADIKEEISTQFGYDLDRPLDEIRPDYDFDISCQGSVPEAIIAFLESTDLEHAIRLAVSLGGDSDTQACIAGSIAQAYYGEIPEEMVREVLERLPEDLLQIVVEFREKYSC